MSNSKMADNILEKDTLKTFIINAIKTLRSHKKRPDELTVLEFVKKRSPNLNYYK